MSWFVVAALGFYSVSAVTGAYVIGSPTGNCASIHNPANGKIFTIAAENNSPENVYTQRVQLNGWELIRSWFTLADIAAGGELRFRMGRKPDKEWVSTPRGSSPIRTG